MVFVSMDADTLGGIQRVTHTLAQGLARRGHEVCVVGVNRPAGPVHWVDEPGYRRLVLQRRVGRPSRARLARLLGSLRSGLVIMTSPGAVAWVGLDVGYRVISWNYDLSSFLWDMTIQGPWIGLSFNF